MGGLKPGARRSDIRSKGCTLGTCTSTRSKERQPCIRAAYRSGWLLAMLHVIGEQHSGRRFVELPP